MCGALLGQGRSNTDDGIFRPAAIDHIIPHAGDTSLFYDIENCWALCCDCHDGDCQRIERSGKTGDALRAEKIAHRVIGLDGSCRRPALRHVDRGGVILGEGRIKTRGDQ